jgi:hypothetical protein
VKSATAIDRMSQSANAMRGVPGATPVQIAPTACALASQYAFPAAGYDYHVHTMSVEARRRLDESDMTVRPELHRYIAAITPLAPSQPRYLGLPRTAMRLLVRRCADGSRVDVHAVGPRTSAVRKPSQPHGALAFELLPGAVSALAGVSAQALAGHAVSLADLWGCDAAALLDQLGAAPPAAYAALVKRR